MTLNLNSSLAGLSLLSGTNSFATFSGGGATFETLAVRRAKAAFTTPDTTPPWKQAERVGSLSSQVSAIRRLSSIVDAGPITGRKLPDDVSAEEKQRRFRAIEETQKAVLTEINNTYFGTTQEVLVDGRNRGRWQGRTSTDKLVFFEPGDDMETDMLGQLVNIRITRTTPWSFQFCFKLLWVIFF